MEVNEVDSEAPRIGDSGPRSSKGDDGGISSVVGEPTEEIIETRGEGIDER